MPADDDSDPDIFVEVMMTLEDPELPKTSSAEEEMTRHLYVDTET